MFLYLVLVIGILSLLLLILSLFADSINSKFNYGNEKDENEMVKARYKVILSIIISFSWAYIIYTLI